EPRIAKPEDLDAPGPDVQPAHGLDQQPGRRLGTGPEPADRPAAGQPDMRSGVFPVSTLPALGQTDM
ncbi:FIG00961164: hypothetical protein, partial [Pseudomonas sp. FEN]